jgi:hypothetical protein
LLLQGAQAHAAGVLFPSDDDTLHRTILIANINPLINTEQVNSCSYLVDSCLSWPPCKFMLLLLICLLSSDVFIFFCCWCSGEAAVWLLWPSQELPHGWQQPICICGVLISRGKPSVFYCTLEVSNAHQTLLK